MASNNNLFQFNLFFSYCGENKNEVYKLYEELKEKGFKIWIDKEEMKSGNVNKLMKKGIDESDVFLCCATTSYCKSDNCMLEWNYAVDIRKKFIYIIFEKFKDKQERIEKLDEISFHLAGQKYFKHEDVEGIVTAIQDLVHMI